MTQDIAPKSTKILPPTRAADRVDKAPRQPRKKSLVKPLEELFTTVGTVVYAVNQADGSAIINGANGLAVSLNTVAKDNAALYKNLERMVTGSAWGSVFIASGAILIPIMANHNLLPFNLPGMEPVGSPEDNTEPSGNIESTAPTSGYPLDDSPAA